MADEIRIAASMTVDNGNLSFSQNYGTKSYTQTAVGGPSPGMVEIGTVEETEAFSELTVPGWCTIQNLDSTNFVEWGFSTGVYGGKLMAGETAGPFRINSASTTLYLKADTAACRIVVNALES
jgi:hypothetical protein